MKLELSRNLESSEFFVFMEIHRASSRRDLIAYAKLAQENDGEITLGILNLFFLDRSEKIAESILFHLVKTGLFTWIEKGKRAKLTNEGTFAAEKEIAYLYEKDLYRVVCCRDTLIPQSIISVERAPWRRSEIRQSQNDSIDENLTALSESIQTPHNIKECIGKELSFIRQSPDDSGEEKVDTVIISSVSDICYPVPSDVQYKLSGKISEGSFFKGEIIGNKTSCRWSIEDITMESAFRALIASESEIQTDSRGIIVLDVVFSKIKSDIEKRSFKSKIVFSNHVLKGPFGDKPLDIIISDVCIRPKDTNEADFWYRWLLEDELNRYMSHSDFMGYADEIKDRFAVFGAERIPVTMIQSLDMACDIEERNKKTGKKPRPEQYWYLMAPHDLRYGGHLNE